jgi:tetratricopeptide (TPR) repeat protein
MDWSAFEWLLRCEPGHEQLHLIILALGGLVSLATVIATVYKLWRWWMGPSGRHKRAARALRIEGKYRAQLNHWARAMDLYDFSIRLNPRAAHVYYLRGELHHTLGNINRAIADWNRCVVRHPQHKDARERLAVNRADVPSRFPWPVAIRTFAGVLLVSLVGWLGFMVLPKTIPAKDPLSFSQAEPTCAKPFCSEH